MIFSEGTYLFFWSWLDYWIGAAIVYSLKNLGMSNDYRSQVLAIDLGTIDV